MVGDLAISIIEKVGKLIYDRFQKERLSDIEGHILVSASNNDGNIAIVELDHPYDLIRIAGDFLYDMDVEPRIAAEYRDAMDSLTAKGYLRQETSKYYQLTTDGYRKADGLKGKQGLTE